MIRSIVLVTSLLFATPAMAQLTGEQKMELMRQHAQQYLTYIDSQWTPVVSDEPPPNWTGGDVNVHMNGSLPPPELAGMDPELMLNALADAVVKRVGTPMEAKWILTGIHESRDIPGGPISFEPRTEEELSRVDFRTGSYRAMAFGLVIDGWRITVGLRSDGRYEKIQVQTWPLPVEAVRTAMAQSMVPLDQVMTMLRADTGLPLEWRGDGTEVTVAEAVDVMVTQELKKIVVSPSIRNEPPYVIWSTIAGHDLYRINPFNGQIIDKGDVRRYEFREYPPIP